MAGKCHINLDKKLRSSHIYITPPPLEAGGVGKIGYLKKGDIFFFF